MGGDLEDLIADLKTIEEQGRVRGLILNVSKSVLISHDRPAADAMISNIPGISSLNPRKLLCCTLPLTAFPWLIAWTTNLIN